MVMKIYVWSSYAGPPVARARQSALDIMAARACACPFPNACIHNSRSKVDLKTELQNAGGGHRPRVPYVLPLDNVIVKMISIDSIEILSSWYMLYGIMHWL